MGQSNETRVQVVELDLHAYYPSLTYRREGRTGPDDFDDTSPLTKKAAKALRDVEPGDVVEVVWDFNTPQYSIVKAERITGGLRGRIELLEKALTAAGIEIPKEAEL